MNQTKLIDDRRDFGGQQRGKMDREIQKIFMPVQLELMKVHNMQFQINHFHDFLEFKTRHQT